MVSEMYRTPRGVCTPQLDNSFLLEQQLHAQASLANLLFYFGSGWGDPREAHMYSWFIDLYFPIPFYLLEYKYNNELRRLDLF